MLHVLCIVLDRENMKLFGVSRFHLTQVHCGVHPAQPEPWVDGLGEGRVEWVEERQFTTGDLEEGQFPCWPVQKDSHPVGDELDGYSRLHASVPGPVATAVAVQSPGRLVFAQPAVVTLSLPGHPSVGDSYESSPTPLCLPVAAPSQSLCAQHLSPEFKPLWVVRVWLLGPARRLPVSLEQRKVSVCSVRIQGEFFGI